MMVDEFYRFGKMKAVCNNHLGVILCDSNYYGLTIRKWIYVPPIDNHADLQETEQCLVLSCNNNMVWRGSDKLWWLIISEDIGVL